MKKFFCIYILFCVFYSAKSFAQYEGTLGMGAHLNYGSKFETVGIGAHLHYAVTNQFRIAPAYTIYAKKDGVNLWTVETDLHYMVPLSWEVSFYPLAGLNYEQFKIKNAGINSEAIAKDSFNRLGANLGLGFQYDIQYRVMANFEVKYQAIKDYSQFLFSAGIGFWF